MIEFAASRAVEVFERMAELVRAGQPLTQEIAARSRSRANGIAAKPCARTIVEPPLEPVEQKKAPTLLLRHADRSHVLAEPQPFLNSSKEQAVTIFSSKSAELASACVLLHLVVRFADRPANVTEVVFRTGAMP